MNNIITTTTTTTRITTTIEYYNKVVLAISESLTTTDEEGVCSTSFRLFRKSFYNKMCKLHGKKWLENIALGTTQLPRCEELVVVSEKYWEHYREHARWVFEDYDHTYITSLKGVREVLKSKDHSRVVVDAIGYNALFYDVVGKPVWQRIHVDYINGGIRNQDDIAQYDVRRAADHLRKHPKVKNVEIIDVPGYNGGGQAVEFDYLASPEEFHKMAVSGYKDLKKEEGDHIGGIGDYSHFEHIRKQLKLGQFRLPK